MLNLWFNPEGFELGGQTFGPLTLLLGPPAFLLSPLAFLLGLLAFLLGLLAFLLSAQVFPFYRCGNPDTMCVVEA